MLNQSPNQSTQITAGPSPFLGDGEGAHTSRLGTYSGYFGFAFAWDKALALRSGVSRPN